MRSLARVGLILVAGACTSTPPAVDLKPWCRLLEDSLRDVASAVTEVKQAPPASCTSEACTAYYKAWRCARLSEGGAQFEGRLKGYMAAVSNLPASQSRDRLGDIVARFADASHQAAFHAKYCMQAYADRWMSEDKPFDVGGVVDESVTEVTRELASARIKDVLAECQGK